MDLNNILANYNRHTQEWLAALDQYDAQSFIRKPADDEWSIAQVYDHLAAVTDKCVANVLACINGKGETGHSGIGPAIFSMVGSFPPVKLKIKKIPAGMDKVYNPQQIDNATARKQLEAALKQMRNVLPEVSMAKKDQRVAHWAGGWFNAKQWYHSAEMHMKHHFMQKKRIDKLLSK
ncbi:MAG: DinB family protein [Sphingobacteriales bacterium]|nr:MAG: DinB family protein [Sphingobacteriales bacterium]